MDLRTFFEQFGTIAEAPGGIQRLRNLILDMAVRGKLVPQDSSDEPAEKLFQRITDDINNLVKQKKVREIKAFSKLEESEIPFEKPINWKWCRLGEVIRVSSGNNLPSKKMADDGKIPVYGGNGIAGYHDEANVYKPTLVIGRVGYYCGSVHITPKTAWVTDNAFITYFSEKNLYINYLYWLFKTIDLQQNNSATAQPVISGGKIYPIPIPLPPLAEQKRIVVKVDELMGLCDQFEAEKQKRDTLRQRLRASAFDALMNAPTDDALSTAWSFIHQHWHPLTQHPDDVQDVRRSLLQLAVRGKLSDTSYSAKKPIKKFLFFQNGYAFKSEWYESNGIRLVRNQNIGHDELRWDDVKYINPQKVIEFERFLLNEGDIVLSLDRPIINTGLKVARIQKEDLPSLLLQRVARPIFEDESLSSEYFFLWLHSPDFINSIDPGRSNGVPHISTRSVEKLLITVPSLVEQKRIVAKVDELMQECDQLEAHLRQQQEVAEQFAASAVSHLGV